MADKRCNQCGRSYSPGSGMNGKCNVCANKNGYKYGVGNKKSTVNEYIKNGGE